jgi:hypothetical protein
MVNEKVVRNRSQKTGDRIQEEGFENIVMVHAPDS